MTTQEKYDRILHLVRKMRGYQKEYWKYRCGEDLRASRRFESQVDQEVEREVRERKSKQQQIF